MEEAASIGEPPDVSSMSLVKYFEGGSEKHLSFTYGRQFENATVSPRAFAVKTY